MANELTGLLYSILRVGATVSGLAGPAPVKILSVDRLTDDSASVAYRMENGDLAEKIVFSDALPHLQPTSVGGAFSFDATPEAFLLAAEARRMKLAHLFDPLAALGTSNVNPLPHQLQAVYGEMLPRQPLRYVLADDPGAGKTVMAGLLIKELLLRGDAANVLVVSPGVLVDQWDEEMREKFGLEFEVLTRDRILGQVNPFSRGGLWLARLDMLARNSEGILDKACGLDWDLIVFDEAHKLSATAFGSQVKKTRRYQMAEELGRHTRNLLLMTATPHSGKEAQFQLFMALLDSDRFEGVAREGTSKTDVSDLMRRLVKEELLTFEGTRLFPERFAYTVQYELSQAEKDLYTSVTNYVRDQMNRADSMEGDRRRKIAVGFALTTLQRRLASSPAAIHRSLERRRTRLTSELQDSHLSPSDLYNDIEVPEDDADIEDLTDAEREALEDKTVSDATTARTPEELKAEIIILDCLLVKSLAVKTSTSYAKWDALRDTLEDSSEMRDAIGSRRKVIIFTEHKDTLDDLVARLINHLGREDAVVTIHGGTRREDRKKAKETFEQDEKCIFLVATDAAGEGVNLHKNAHLVLNYDLPWNPNRIEQRFGRVHRIGQLNVCHMWSLVAKDTREGNVYTRLLEKMGEQRSALGGRVYDVLGSLFEGNSLRDLMIQAVREENTPERQRYLTEVVDAKIADGVADLLEANQLVSSNLAKSTVEEVRRQMDRAEAARLQPHHVEAFFHKAFKDLGGNLRIRENHRYEIKTVPADVREQNRLTGSGAPVVNAYHRVAFDPQYVRVAGNAHVATLLHPGHPLMAATMDVITDHYRDALRRGAILVDRAALATTPYVVCLLEHDVTDGRTGKDGQPLVVSRRAQYVRVDADSTISALTQSPIPNLDAASEEESSTGQEILTEPWCQSLDLDTRVVRYASQTVAREHAEVVLARTVERVTKTERLVRDRLTKEINYWDQRAFELAEHERAGKRTRLPASQLRQRAEALSRRLERRLKELEKERDVSARPPRITGACLVITQGWLDALEDPDAATYRAKETIRIERLAVDAVLRVEDSLGHSCTEMPHNNPGYDIESGTPDGLDFIEVKGRFHGGTTFVLTRQEAVTALNKGIHSVLALVRVNSDDSTAVGYIRNPITSSIDPRAARVEFDWDPFWNNAEKMEP
ncbi:helicase-related protein [Paenarthrobacter sp. PH39-S1]|uniref:helicase-related protein n=1 Tax=Paenarthrobacter sp. PH39-S1 TaxID=3046204 RepID=UPI0024B96748|nr:helicase-related protein [Paenarthrobacter sp. PH39-S1]MDJ0357674.1 helicase-related protein [Paenarthrobacter sp. PH39-S1]